ncbi:MAG: hypothetical protein IPK16_32410 [Anaerolineales bacterium]|nr:hypothetical protein [Anaerolineales bacterium]
MLTSKQIDHFRKLLERQKAELEHQIAAWKQDLGDPNYGSAAGVDDELDLARRLFDAENEETLMVRALSELRQVKHALQRLEDGVYGLSEVSGQPIPIERLEAVPSATTLVGEKNALN